MNEYVVIFEEAQDGGWGAAEMRELGKPLPEPIHIAGTARA